MGDNPKYAKEYDLPYPEGVEYPYKRMPMLDRAAQFASFKALSGYEDAVDEAARLTDAKIELDEATVDLLNAKIQILQDHIAEEPEITVTYFLPDKKKAGGKYVTTFGKVKRIDDYERVIQFTDRNSVPMDDILALDGEVFDILKQDAEDI